MSHKHHARTSSHKVLPAHARPSKPPPILKRGHSYNNGQGQGQSGSSKLVLGGSKKTTAEVVLQQDEEQDEDMASFLQFCPTCERQIVTPGASILYCSESCRKKDISTMSPMLTTHSPATSYFDAADIVPQRSPTVVRPLSLTFSDMSFDDIPSIPEDDEIRQRRDSEAARYLAGFHSSTWTGDQTIDRRPKLNRASTATDSSGLPSLIHTPSSSVASNASVPAIRPLPSRHNKSYSACSSKPIDLYPSYAIPAPSSPTQLMRDASMKSSASTLTSFRVAESSDLSYDRRNAGRRSSEAEGSLKQLFRHEAMKAPPTQASQISRLE